MFISASGEKHSALYSVLLPRDSFSSWRFSSISESQQTCVASCCRLPAAVCTQIQNQHRAETGCTWLLLSTDPGQWTETGTVNTCRKSRCLMFSVRIQYTCTGRRTAGEEPDADGLLTSLRTTQLSFRRCTEVYSQLVNLADIQLTRISDSALPRYADVSLILISLIIAEMSGNLMW